MSTEKQINQLIEQVKLDLNNYQLRLSEIELESSQEKERLLEAIRAEAAEIQSLLSQYRDIKQRNEVEVMKSSFASLSNFKQSLIEKIKQEANNSDTNQNFANIEKQIEKFESLSDLNLESLLQEENGTRESNIQISEEPTVIQNEDIQESNNHNLAINPLNTAVEDRQSETISELIQFIERTGYQRLVKLYPDNLAQAVPHFDFADTVVRDRLLKHYQKLDKNIYNSLIKLYQKPEIRYQGTVPIANELNPKDRSYHDFILDYYPKTLPLFWYLVNREPQSIKYVVMECAKDHIIYTNEIDYDSNDNKISISFPELLDMNNGESLEAYLRNIFVCFHPKRSSNKDDSKNKYFEYINNIITQEATLEHSKALKFWSQMKQFGYDAVAADDFPVSSRN